MSQQLLDWAKQALEMLNDNHHLVADNEKHAYVMMHLDVIERGKALLKQPEPTQCWKCGDMDAMGHAKCDVPACGMREKNTALDKMAGNACELGLNYDTKGGA